MFVKDNCMAWHWDTACWCFRIQNRSSRAWSGETSQNWLPKTDIWWVDPCWSICWSMYFLYVSLLILILPLITYLFLSMLMWPNRHSLLTQGWHFILLFLHLRRFIRPGLLVQNGQSMHISHLHWLLPRRSLMSITRRWQTLWHISWLCVRGSGSIYFRCWCLPLVHSTWSNGENGLFQEALAGKSAGWGSCLCQRSSMLNFITIVFLPLTYDAVQSLLSRNGKIDAYITTISEER